MHKNLFSNGNDIIRLMQTVENLYEVNCQCMVDAERRVMKQIESKGEGRVDGEK